MKIKTIHSRVVHTIVTDLLAPVLLGQDARQIQVLWEQMFSAMRLRSHTMGFTAEAIAGLDIALWDLLGKYRQEPVWRLLGGAYRQTLPVYSSGIPGDTSEKQVQQLEGILARGFTTAKCGSLQMQMDLIRPLSKAMGDRGTAAPGRRPAPGRRHPQLPGLRISDQF